MASSPSSISFGTHTEARCQLGSYPRHVTTCKAAVFSARPLVTRVAIGVDRLGSLGNWYMTSKQTVRWSISHDQGNQDEIRDRVARNVCVV